LLHSATLFWSSSQPVFVLTMSPEFEDISEIFGKSHHWHCINVQMLLYIKFENFLFLSPNWKWGVQDSSGRVERISESCTMYFYKFMQFSTVLFTQCYLWHSIWSSFVPVLVVQFPLSSTGFLLHGYLPCYGSSKPQSGCTHCVTRCTTTSRLRKGVYNLIEVISINSYKLIQYIQSRLLKTNELKG
jgi:hypothetical protein